MALPTRQNPDNGNLEVLIQGEWVLFEQYRKQQIDDAYQTSVKFLRERLDEDHARNTNESIEQKIEQTSGQ